MSTITLPGGTLGALSSTTYLGFAIGETGPQRIAQKVFTDAVAADQVATAAGRISTTILDALGRDSRVEAQLGGDYQNQTLVVGQRSYDSLGRVAYEADPYLLTQGPVYATWRYFKDDGTPDCTVRGPISSFSTTVIRSTNESLELYPTCFTRSFSGHREVLSTQGPDSLLDTSPQNNVVESVTRSAAGLTLAHSTSRNGTTLEYATYDYDGLSRLLNMKRYRDPAGR